VKNTIEKALQKQAAAKKQAEREEAQSKSQSEAVKTTEKSDNFNASIDPVEETAETNLTAQKSENAESPSTDATNTQDKASVNASRKSKYKLNFAALEEKGFVSTTGQRKQINEEYREIKRKLLSNAFGPISKTLNNSNVIMVTSGRPSEGKTFTAANLALSIASEQDKTVLLVDADVLKPNVLRTLGLERRKGLMEYLMGEVEEVADVLYPTNIDTLKIIPA